METGRAAPTWLDQHLDDDARWAEGVPADADSWVADAFADLAALSDDELASRATAFDESSESSSSTIASTDTINEGGVDADGGNPAADLGVVVDDWLAAAPGFTAADDVAFVIDEADVVGDAVGPPVATGSLDADATPTSTLTDPFDVMAERNSGDDLGAEVLGGEVSTDHDDAVPVDDIVTSATSAEVRADQTTDVLPPDGQTDATESAGLDADVSGADVSGASASSADLVVDDDAGSLLDVFEFDDAATPITLDDVDLPDLTISDEALDDASFGADADDEWHDDPAEWADD